MFSPGVLSASSQPVSYQRILCACIGDCSWLPNGSDNYGILPHACGTCRLLRPSNGCKSPAAHLQRGALPCISCGGWDNRLAARPRVPTSTLVPVCIEVLIFFRAEDSLMSLDADQAWSTGPEPLEANKEINGSRVEQPSRKSFLEISLFRYFSLSQSVLQRGTRRRMILQSNGYAGYYRRMLVFLHPATITAPSQRITQRWSWATSTMELPSIRIVCEATTMVMSLLKETQESFWGI